MSMLAMSDAEVRTIDSKVEQMMDWARTRQAEAEQLALDSARLMACTTDRLDRLQKQNFFMRCWNRFNGDAAAAERANANDVIQMQKTAFRYVNMLQEHQLLMAHSLLSVKNNLMSLAIKEEETRNLIYSLAKRTLERFEKLENRVDQLEISTNLHAWLLSVDERNYDIRYPTMFMRTFRIINDFYSIKNDKWDTTDLFFMRKALRLSGIDSRLRLSLGLFIDNLIDEIMREDVGFVIYEQLITLFKPKSIDDYSKFVIDNISSPIFLTLHDIKNRFIDRREIVDELQEEMNITAGEALKRIIKKGVSKLNVNMHYELPLGDCAIEILGAMRLVENLSLLSHEHIATSNDSKESINNKNRQKNNIDLYGDKIMDIILGFNYGSCYKLLQNIFVENGPSHHNLSVIDLSIYRNILKNEKPLVLFSGKNSSLILTKEHIYKIVQSDKVYYKIQYTNITSLSYLDDNILYINNDNDLSLDYGKFLNSEIYNLLKRILELFK